jgi:polysaccharide deacetylase 2 family uncharacterized protein YibQ
VVALLLDSHHGDAVTEELRSRIDRSIRNAHALGPTYCGDPSDATVKVLTKEQKSLILREIARLLEAA